MKSIQVIVKCWTPDHYSEVSHAIIEFNEKLLDTLESYLATANQMQEQDSDFMGIEYGGYHPYFIDSCPDDEDLQDGWDILSKPLDLEKLENSVSMRPCMLMVMAGHGLNFDNGRIYWYGYDKHGDAGCRAETYAFSAKTLRVVRSCLEEKE